jgi:hypothetical protein
MATVAAGAIARRSNRINLGGMTPAAPAATQQSRRTQQPCHRQIWAPAPTWRDLQLGYPWALVVIIAVEACGCARGVSPATTMHCSASGLRISVAVRLLPHTRRCKDSADLGRTGQEVPQERQTMPGFVRIAGSKAVLSGAPTKIR